MGILDDTAIFVAVVQQGGFSRAAAFLGLSNGLVSRRIAQLETTLGASLLKRTTRQLNLTPEGEILWRHSKRIQQELNSALSCIQASAEKPKGTLRISAPAYFGRHYLTPIIVKFLQDFEDIHIELILTNQMLDPIQDHLDLVIRSSGYLDNKALQDSSLHMKPLFKEKICLYASPEYLLKYGEPKDAYALYDHTIIGFTSKSTLAGHQQWTYSYQQKSEQILLKPNFNCNDIESSLSACIAGYGIGRYTELNVKKALSREQLRPILNEYEWGTYHLFALYSNQQALPARTRMMLDFISAHSESKI